MRINDRKESISEPVVRRKPAANHPQALANYPMTRASPVAKRSTIPACRKGIRALPCPGTPPFLDTTGPQHSSALPCPGTPPVLDPSTRASHSSPISSPAAVAVPREHLIKRARILIRPQEHTVSIMPGFCLNDASILLRCLTFVDLEQLRAASIGMRALRKDEVLRRLRKFHYDADAFGFYRPRYSNSGRLLRNSTPTLTIAERMCKFLQHFSKYIEELHFENAPCDLLENPLVVKTLSRVGTGSFGNVSLAVFPSQGWSGISAQRKVTQALRPSVSHKFVGPTANTLMRYLTSSRAHGNRVP